MHIPYGEILKNRNFTLLLFGRIFKRSSLVLFSMELIWLTMELTDSSPVYLSLMVMAETLPFIIFGVYGGVKADKWNKKSVLVISDFFVSIILMLLPILYLLDIINYFILMFIAILITLFNCFSEPSFRAIIPELLPNNQLQEGNALLDSVQRGASILIPASIGIILKITTQIHLFSLASMLMIIAAFCHLLLKYSPITYFNYKDSSLNPLDDIKHTLGFLKKNKNIRFIIIVQGISIIINTGLWRVGLPIYLEDYLGKNIETFGYITGVLGASSLIASISLGMFKKVNQILAFSIGVTLWGVGLLIIGISPSMDIIYLATILIGVGQAIEGLTRVILFQEQVPGNMLGKVFSISSSINYTSDTLSLGTISVMLAFFTVPLVFVGGGISILLTGVLGMLTLSKESKSDNLYNKINKKVR